MKMRSAVVTVALLSSALSQEAEAQVKSIGKGRTPRDPASSGNPPADGPSALVPRDSSVAVRSPYEAPRTSTERSLAQLWGELLRVEKVGATDRFCALGGHSLTATQTALKIESTFGVRLVPRLLLANPTVEELSATIDRQRTPKR